MSYDDIHDNYDINVHGGLTFADYAIDLDWKEIPEEYRDHWIIGFDTAHLDDNITIWSMDAVFEETMKLKDQVNKYYTPEKINEFLNHK